MIEYLYDAIKATSGEEIAIAAKITDENGIPILNNCHFNLYDDTKQLAKVDGVLNGEEWVFTVPAETTANLSGRYWYCICNEQHKKLSFKQPIYLV